VKQRAKKGAEKGNRTAGKGGTRENEYCRLLPFFCFLNSPLFSLEGSGSRPLAQKARRPDGLLFFVCETASRLLPFFSFLNSPLFLPGRV
jgi:hypothetical protein